MTDYSLGSSSPLFCSISGGLLWEGEPSGNEERGRGSFSSSFHVSANCLFWGNE